uniref:PHD-type domain-containing protein n=1 Tax=Caenorhabditis tropicalis TaxID=1561998 RepID=A0A1I7ULV5_9PELO
MEDDQGNPSNDEIFEDEMTGIAAAQQQQNSSQEELQEQQRQIRVLEAEPTPVSQGSSSTINRNPEPAQQNLLVDDEETMRNHLMMQNFFNNSNIIEDTRRRPSEEERTPETDVFQPADYNPALAPHPSDGQPRDSRFDANEHTVWIDSDGDDEPEDEAMKQNFYLPYNDHNYDCWDPTMRVIHPEEGPFPILDGLDEQGNVVNIRMPEGYEHLLDFFDNMPAAAATHEAASPQHQPQAQQPQHEYQSPPPHHIQSVPRARPVNTAAPFSIGGNQVEYAEAPRIPVQRGISTRDSQQFRVYGNEYGSPMMAPSSAPRTAPINRISGAIRDPLRANEQQLYPPRGGAPIQQPQQRLNPSMPMAGSYQHIAAPMPGIPGPQRRPPIPQPVPRGRSVQGMMSMRPIGRSAPQQRITAEERELIENPMPTTMPPHSVPAARRIQDVPPHRMSDQERANQQQARQRAIFPQQRPPGTPTSIRAQGTVIARRVPDSEELLRSPQRVAPQQQQQPTLEPPRRFQLKVTDTYSTPIPKASDQLPAQLTEDPDEPSTSSAPAKEPEVTEPQEQAETMEPEVAKSPIKSPVRVPSAVSSPIKQAVLQKPTPPHRMTQEEKSAHFAKLATEKEKPASLQAAASSSSSSSQHHNHAPPPLPLRHPQHAEDSLAVIQSAFDPSKPREPDTPKDKEEISKIADELRFSADKFTVQGVGHQQQQRQRTISGGHPRGQPYHPIHPHHQQQMHQQMDLMSERKRLGSGRYDNMNLQGQPIPPHLRNVAPPQEPIRVRHPEADLEPPHRQRGRPRGSTGPQRQRWPSGHDPLAAQRGAGGARTLPPRQDGSRSARNGLQNNSDSESEGIEGEESWVMRCHCGMDHGDGDTIECESCKTWQHMACMGLSPKSDTSNYKCELCSPRKLSVTKAEAVKMQKKILEKLIKATEKEKKKRKSDLEPIKKQVQQPSTSRKSIPNDFQQAPLPYRFPQLNEYSKAAAQLLNSMPQTAGADTLLQDSRLHKKARRMFVEENVEALVTTEVVAIRQVILEVNGYVSMEAEAKRQPGGGNCVFVYDGLMKGTAGEETGNGKQEYVCVDAKKKGNDTKFTRRSCLPNCVLKHVLGSQATLGIMVVATKDIHRNTEVTLPFDYDWVESEQVLECAEHMKNINACPFEKERREKKREQEEARRAGEERRRLEEEVRQERAAKTRQMDEEAERERIEQERAKKAEREEARRKREAEKKKERDEKEKKEAEEKEKIEKEKAERRKKWEQEEADKAKAEEEEALKKLPGGCSRTTELPISAREERRIKQEEERFRRQEEEEKRKEIMKARAEARKSLTPGDDEPSTSDASYRRASGRKHGRRDSQSSELEMDSRDSAKSNKRNTLSAGLSPSSKRYRITAAAGAAFLDIPANRKRTTSSTTTPTVAKRAKGDGFKAGDIGDSLIANAEIHTQTSVDYMLPAELLGEPVSEWVRKMRTPDTKKVYQKEQRKKEEEYSKWLDKDLKARKKALEQEVLEAALEKERKGEEEAKAAEEAAKAAKAAPEALEAPASPKKAPEVKTPAPEKPSKAPEPPVKTPKAPEAAPVKAPKPVEAARSSADREASLSTEGSVEKEIPSSSSSTAPEKKQKKISMEEYSRRKQNKTAESTSSATAATSSSTTPSAAPRRGFIPSTEGLANVQVQLSAIPLDNHMNVTTTTTTVAPSGPTPPPPPPPSELLAPPPPPPPLITSPSTRARARGAASESSDEIPAEHRRSLTDRINGIFGPGVVTAVLPPQPPPPQQQMQSERNNSTSSSSSRGIAPPPPPPPLPQRSRNRPTRWND